MTISRDRWQLHLKTPRPALPRPGARAGGAARAPTRRVGAGRRRAGPARAGRGARALPGSARLTRHQHVLFRLGELDRLRRGRGGAGPPGRRAPRTARSTSARPRASTPAALAAAQPHLRARGRAARWPTTGCAGCSAADGAGGRRRPRAARSACRRSTRAQAGLLADMDARGRRPLRRASPAPSRPAYDGSRPWKTPRSRAIAIVGRRGHPARRPERPRLLGQRASEGRYSITRGPARPLGSRRSTTTPTRRRPTRPTRRSAAGCATASGIRSPGSCPSRRRSRDAMDEAQKWAIACTREALADYGWPERAARPRAHRRRSSATRWPASSTT